MSNEYTFRAQYKNIASNTTYNCSIGNHIQSTSTVAEAFSQYKKNQNTAIPSSSSDSMYDPTIVSSTASFSTTLLKTRLDSTTKNNAEALRIVYTIHNS